MSVTLELYDRARASIRERGFDSATQTKIALFVGAAKTVNAAIMSAFAVGPNVTVAYPFVHGQYFRELEFASLLARVTHWSPSVGVYIESADVVRPVWAQYWGLLPFSLAPTDGSAAYGALALGHALLARVRLTPIIAEDANELDPFVIALRLIEQEGGRMIQAQIRLLKGSECELGADERAAIIEEKQTAIDAAFGRFLEWVAADATESIPWCFPFAPAGSTVALLDFANPVTHFFRAVMPGFASARATAPVEGER